MTLDEPERVARLRLARTGRVGPVAHARLLVRYGSAAAALHAWRRWAPEGAGPPPPHAAEAELAAVQALGGRTLFPGEDDYPALLAAARQPPPFVHLIGRAGAPPQRAVAIVGARNASASGLRLAHDLAHAVACAGWLVVSGLARGIDAAAHRGALAAEGLTLACLASGPDVAYPPEHAELMAAIAHAGWLLSEQPPGLRPTQQHFPRRNRLIAGLAQATLVVEATRGSGSLLTARMAADEGRDVLAVPGHPLDPRARGGNGLLKDGATLVEDATDLLAALDPYGAALRDEARAAAGAARPGDGPPPPAPPPAPGKPHGGVLHLVGRAPVEVAWLAEQAGLSPAELGRQLTEWELEGLVQRLPGNRVALAAGVAARGPGR